MPTLPSVAPFAGLLADLAADLRRGSCCLVECDKGWTLPLFAALKDRLRAAGLAWVYLDGRVGEEAAGEAGLMVVTVAQMRSAVRLPAEKFEACGLVLVLPHLDVMTTTAGGWTTISREVVPLLYENPAAVWLGFKDPSLELPEVVAKVFARRYVIAERFRMLETVPPPPFRLPDVPIPPPVKEPVEVEASAAPDVSPEPAPAAEEPPPDERVEW